MLPYSDQEGAERGNDNDENDGHPDVRAEHGNIQWPASARWGQSNLIGTDHDDAERGLGVHPSGLGRLTDG
jgi:hypothetical protein